MTNEQMAELAAAGDRQALHELWKAVAPLCCKIVLGICNRQDPGQLESHGVVVEDLLQEVYFAFLDAVTAFDPSTGYKFTSYLKFPIRNMCAKALGYRTKGDDPLNRSTSLDVPAGNDTEGGEPFANTISDPNSERQLDETIEKVYRTPAHDLLETAMQRYCTDLQRSVLTKLYFEGKTIAECAGELRIHKTAVSCHEVNALRALRRCPMWKQLKAMLPDDN